MTEEAGSHFLASHVGSELFNVRWETLTDRDLKRLLIVATPKGETEYLSRAGGTP